MPLIPPVQVTTRSRVRSSTCVAARRSTIIGATAAATSYAIGQDLLERVCVVLAHLLLLKMILDASARRFAQSPAKRGVGQQETDRRRQRERIIRLDENSVLPVIDDLQNAVHVRSHHCLAAGHRFERGDAEGLESG